MVHDFSLARFSRKKSYEIHIFFSTNFSVVDRKVVILYLYVVHNSSPEIIFRIITFFIIGR